MKVVLFCQLLLSWVTTADHLLLSQHPPLSQQASLFISTVRSLSAANTNLKAVGSINVVAWVQITDNYPQRNTFSEQQRQIYERLCCWNMTNARVPLSEGASQFELHCFCSEAKRTWTPRILLFAFHFLWPKAFGAHFGAHCFCRRTFEQKEPGIEPVTLQPCSAAPIHF